MGSKSEKDRIKQIQERCQTILVQLLKDEDNKYCVDCDAKGPRWASWNLGIFLCIRCAGIHRNLGVHISKVKSVNLDSWTPEQVVSLQQMGNSRARAVYEANLPDSFRRPQVDSALEAFIRAKYEQKKYIAKEWVPQPTPKVNWDKEIDEEIERTRKKKKSALAPLPTAPSSLGDKKHTKTDVIPQLLPKPKAVSPKQSRSAASSDARPSNGAADLLGLDTSAPETKPSQPQDDIFSNFFSAPQTDLRVETKPPEPTRDLKAEEQNFFNQPVPTEKEKSKMTKDSILALYSQTPSNVTNQFGSAPTGYNQQYNQYQQPSFASFPQNGQSQSAQFSQSQFSQPQSNQAQFGQGFSQYQQQNAFPAQPQFAQFGSTVQGNFTQNGAFGSNATQQQPLQQQFNNLSLGQNFASPQNANVASNVLWQ